MSPPRIRIDRVEITNFKGIDHLVIDFPRPAFDHDPDITVMGSENGLGKTSVFEAIGLMMYVLEAQIRKGYLASLVHGEFEISDRIVMSGKANAYAKAQFSKYTSGNSNVINKSAAILAGAAEGGFGVEGLEGSKEFFFEHFTDADESIYHAHQSIDYAYCDFFPLSSLFGISGEPYKSGRILYLNSYRKVREGGMSLQSLIDKKRSVEQPSFDPRDNGYASTSTAKQQILRALLVSANLFEEITGEDETEALDLLNRLLGHFANVKLDKLRSGDRNSIDFRVRPLDGNGSFSFDGLSSGQKEIVSTLFLIWRATKDTPCIVLIDEPELHLNAQWHKQVVRWLHKIAPWNQYILATHSADVFAAVPESQRILLRRGPDQ